MNLLARLKIAWAAFRYARTAGPAYAVIYDSFEGLDSKVGDPDETYYEVFMSPEEAHEMFDTAYPKSDRDMGVTVAGSERLVLILGPIDDYIVQRAPRSPTEQYEVVM